MKKQIIKYIPVILIGVLVVFGCQNKSYTYYNDGLREYLSKDYQGAKESFNKCIESDKSDTLKNKAILYLALCHFELKEYEKAINELTIIMEKTPKSSTDLGSLYFYRSINYFGMEKYAEAINDINIALQLNMPKQLKEALYINRALCKYKSGDFIGAKADSIILQKDFYDDSKTFNDFKMDLQKGKIN